MDGGDPCRDRSGTRSRDCSTPNEPKKSLSACRSSNASRSNSMKSVRRRRGYHPPSRVSGISRRVRTVDDAPASVPIGPPDPTASASGPLIDACRVIKIGNVEPHLSCPNLAKNDAPDVMGLDGYEGHSSELEDYTVGFETYTEDADQPSSSRACPTTRCPCPTRAYRAHRHPIFTCSDGDTMIQAGEAYHTPPGHLPISMPEPKSSSSARPKNSRRRCGHREEHGADGLARQRRGCPVPFVASGRDTDFPDFGGRHRADLHAACDPGVDFGRSPWPPAATRSHPAIGRPVKSKRAAPSRASASS